MTRSHNASSKAVRGAHRASATRLLVSFVVLLAFSLQSYATQTHIHLAHLSNVGAGNAAPAVGAKQQPDKFPPGEDPANCPICQEILHCGQFVTPAAALLLLPSLAVSIVRIVAEASVVAQSASHAWRSRAPPAA